MDKGPEWRAFNPSEKEAKTRASQPLESSRSTIISKPNRDARGRKLKLPQVSLMKRLRRWQSRSKNQSSIERNLVRALTEMDGLASRLHIPSQVKEEATKIYRQALDNDLVRGRSIERVVAASLYAACRLTRNPRSLKEVAEKSPESMKDIARCYRLIHNRLDMDTPNPDARNRVSRIAESLGMSEKAKGKAVDILTVANEAKMNLGKHPVGLAAAALYIAGRACGEHVTQDAVAEASGVTTVTIRNRYQVLEKFLQENELDDDLQ
jgi:transcription initiation factor TFIIB